MGADHGTPVDGGPPSGADRLEELGRHLRAADALLVGLVDDMAAAGARSASERIERARAELTAARTIVERLRDEADDAPA